MSTALTTSSVIAGNVVSIKPGQFYDEVPYPWQLEPIIKRTPVTNKTIYLAGLISTDHPASLQWRIDVAPVLRDAGATVLSPMRGKQDLTKETKDGGLTSVALTPKDIILRDFDDVQRADVILAHLDLFGSTRPLTGTVYELAWAWMLRKPVVAVASPDNYLMRNHPFVKDTVAHYSETIDQALDILWRHYLYPEDGRENAINMYYQRVTNSGTSSGRIV